MYLLDTNVLLKYPSAISNFDGEIALSIRVIEEIDGLKNELEKSQSELSEKSNEYEKSSEKYENEIEQKLNKLKKIDLQVMSLKNEISYKKNEMRVIKANQKNLAHDLNFYTKLNSKIKSELISLRKEIFIEKIKYLNQYRKLKLKPIQIK